MKRHWFKDQRGVVLIFTIFLLLLLLMMGGAAIDLTQHGSVRRELQRSMDAASLAAAGNLGFDDTVFDDVRDAAQLYADRNGYSDPTAGTIALGRNEANDADGDIVLGVWDGAGFTPSLNGAEVNAVQCSFATDIPTSFLRIIPGRDTLPVSASSIAVSNPPEIIPPDSCVFPIALSCCAFGCPNQNPDSPPSAGCGKPVTFITSSKKDEDCIEPPCTNTATWANLCGTKTPTVPVTTDAIEDAAEGTCTTCNVGGDDPIGTNNGMLQPVFDTLEDVFLEQYNLSNINAPDNWHTVEGDPGYFGPGWKVFVPVIDTACPTGAISGVHDVVGWTEFVMTAVVNKGTCYPSNPVDFPAMQAAGVKSCPDTEEPAMRAAFGYYNCTLVEGVGSRDPGVRSALGTNLRLVQ